MKKILSVVLACSLMMMAACTDTQPETSVSTEGSGEAVSEYTDVAVLSTSDMHGKCWETDVLSGSSMPHNMLRVASVAKALREEYGEENVILIDNGDSFQGSMISQLPLLDSASGDSVEDVPMAVCLKEIGYDAFVLGNHEFNYPWALMSGIYNDLEDNGVSVLAANVYYDGSTDGHQAGENVLTPYLIKTVVVNGHEHKIGILGLENTDITRWDVEANYPGMIFAHPDNDGYQISYEVNRYIPQMKAEGCEFIIVSYHAALGNDSDELEFGVNSENQGLRLLESTGDIDLLILGHDHSSGYSNDLFPDKDGNDVLVVNAGGKDATNTVFRFSENAEGGLAYEIVSSENVDLTGYTADPELQELIRPYADSAETYVNEPIGNATGPWDELPASFIRQTNTVDVVLKSMIFGATQSVSELYDSPADLAASGIEIDHLDVDMAVMSSAVSYDHFITPGELSLKETYSIQSFVNYVGVFALKGSQIKEIMEYNATNHLTSRILDGTPYFYNFGNHNNYVLFGGVNFRYDMSAPEGSRVLIDSFANGRPFEEDNVYLVAITNFLMGNNGSGLSDYTSEDTIFMQTEEGDSNIQDYIAAFIKDECEKNGSLTPDCIDWSWSVEYLAEPVTETYDGPIAATYSQGIEDGHSYVIYNEASRMILSDTIDGNDCEGVYCEAVGNCLTGELPQNAMVLTVHCTPDGFYEFRDQQGRYLCCSSAGGGLSLSDGSGTEDLRKWSTMEVEGGNIIICVGSASDITRGQALQYYDNHFMTYKVMRNGAFIYNFYEI